jgi:hypothetical protein
MKGKVWGLMKGGAGKDFNNRQHFYWYLEERYLERTGRKPIR